MILVVDIISYPEMCAEHGVPRSASAPVPSLSAFFIIFFSKQTGVRVRARAFVDAIDAMDADLGRLAGQFWGGFRRLGTRRRSSRAGGRCVRLPPHITYS